MQVSDIPDWDKDPDLSQFPAWLRVTVEMMDVYDASDIIVDPEKAKRYAEIYKQRGAWGMPPVICIGDPGWHIGGAHRMHGAHLAGLKKIPTFVIHKYGDDR